jgi:CDP-diacylglycerol--serine O-phosphatidyltransferase
MSKRPSTNAANGSAKDAIIVGEPAPAIDKQKKLLQESSGHFSMIRMLHLADLITELNGKPCPPSPPPRCPG